MRTPGVFATHFLLAVVDAMQPIVASSKAELLSQLRRIDISVPPRGDGRTTEHSERWSICRLLSTLAEAQVLRYPIELEHRDRPDFVLTQGGELIGIEFTEAIPANWAWANAKREENAYDNFIPLQKFVPGEPLRTADEVDAIARGTNWGDGWVGDAPERQWSDAMLHFAIGKAKKLAHPGFTPYAHNWLLIYDNWPLPALEEEVAARHFASKLAFVATPFERIFVECTQHMCKGQHSMFQTLSDHLSFTGSNRPQAAGRGRRENFQ